MSPVLVDRSNPTGRQMEKNAGKGRQQNRPVIPFIRAAHEIVESAFDSSYQPGAAAVNLGPFDVPARGFLRSVWLLIEGSGGVLGGGSLAADFPFNVFDSVVLQDVNGANIVGPIPSYSLYIANLYGGYAWAPNVTAFPDYDGTINCRIMLRVPVEIDSWDGYGSLPNQNAAQTFKLAITGAPTTTLFAVAVTTAPTIRVRGFVETWSQPDVTDLLGNPQEQEPPGVGTTQYWTRNLRNINAGAQTVQLVRVGNLIRNLIFVQRNAAGARVTADFPDPLTLLWDSRQILVEPRIMRRTLMYERFGFSSPAGVFVIDFTHDQDGHGGNESRHLWLPTVQSSRIEIQGSFANAGTLEILTNDVAPAGLIR